MRVHETKEGCVLDVVARPRSRENKVTVEAEGLVVFCKEEPVKGRVNREVTRQLTRLFHKRVEIVSGFSSRDKRMLVRGASKIEIEETLDRF